MIDFWIAAACVLYILGCGNQIMTVRMDDHNHLHPASLWIVIFAWPAVVILWAVVAAWDAVRWE